MRGREATERARLEREVEQMKRDMAVLAEQLEAQEPAQRGEDDPLQRRVKELEEQLENANSIIDELVKGVEEALWERLLTNTRLHWDLLEGGLQIALHLSYPHDDDAVHVGTRSRLDV